MASVSIQSRTTHTKHLKGSDRGLVIIIMMIRKISKSTYPKTRTVHKFESKVKDTNKYLFSSITFINTKT